MLEITPKQLESKKFFLWIGMIIVIVVVGVVLLNKQISQFASKLQDRKSQIQAIKNREENINKLQETYSKIENDLPTVTAVLPDEENIISFVQYLEGLSTRLGTNLELVFDDKLNAQVEQNKYLVFKVTISGSGPMVESFWQSLEAGPYFINVTSFNFGTVDGLGSDTQLKLAAKVFTNESYKITQ